MDHWVITSKEKKTQYPTTNLSECHYVRTIISYAVAGDKTRAPSVKGQRITGRSMTGRNKHQLICFIRNFFSYRLEITVFFH